MSRTKCIWWSGWIITTNKNAVNIINWSSFYLKIFHIECRPTIFRVSAAGLYRFIVSHPNQKMNQKGSWFISTTTISLMICLLRLLPEIMHLRVWWVRNNYLLSFTIKGTSTDTGGCQVQNEQTSKQQASKQTNKQVSSSYCG